MQNTSDLLAVFSANLYEQRIEFFGQPMLCQTISHEEQITEKNSYVLAKNLEKSVEILRNLIISKVSKIF